MNDLQKEYGATKQKLEQLKESLLNSVNVEKGDLIQDNKTNKFYRVAFKSVRDDGDVCISTKEIKNHRINWESCSTPVYKLSEGLGFTKSDWKFDTDKVSELEDLIYETDSISEKEECEKQLRAIYLSCKHAWEYISAYDKYTCKCCGVESRMEVTKDWLNGETENHNIDLSSVM